MVRLSLDLPSDQAVYTRAGLHRVSALEGCGSGPIPASSGHNRAESHRHPPEEPPPMTAVLPDRSTKSPQPRRPARTVRAVVTLRVTRHQDAPPSVSVLSVSKSASI